MESINPAKNQVKDFIKKKLYISLKRILTQISAQLIVYSDRKQIINQDKWERMINSSFKRNLRDAHKEVKEAVGDDNYWKKYMQCINKFRDYFKEYVIGNDIENTKDVIFRIWGGIPKFDLFKVDRKKILFYIVFKDETKEKILKLGCFFISLRRRNQTSEVHISYLNKVTKKFSKKCNNPPERESIFYITPYDVCSFNFKLDEENIMDQKSELEEGNRTVQVKNQQDNLKVEGEVNEESSQLRSNDIINNRICFDDIEWIGKLIQTQKKPMRQGRGTRRVEDIVIEGWLYEEFCHLARHDRFFIAQHPDLGTKNDHRVPNGHRRRLLIRIDDFKDWSQNVAHEISDDPKLGHYTQCWFNFERFLDSDELGSFKAVPIAGTGIDQYKIRDLNLEEYHDVYELPKKGVSLGLFLHDDDITIQGYPITKIPFYFPVSNINYEQLFYTPTFFVGRPGSGKTNALKTLTASSLSCNDYKSGEKPAFIFFDYEGQFSSLAKPPSSNVGDSEDKQIWEYLKLKPVDYNNVTIISQSGLNPSQFSFKELIKDIDINLKIKTLQYFLRNLSEITEIAFKEISRKIFNNLSPKTYVEYRREFKNELNNQTIDASKQLGTSQRKALIRTFHDDEISIFFDQPGKSFDLSDLIEPERVIVFDLKDISKEKAILYVLLILQKIKLEKNLLKTPVIVVIDEAHEIFKKVSGSSREARYYKLISKFLAEFGSRGRKYRLGLWLASQRPQDLHADIQKVIGTYFILGLNPEHKRWLTSTLGSSKNADFIMNLPNRFALFKNSSLYMGNTYILKLVKSPNIHRTFV